MNNPLLFVDLDDTIFQTLGKCQGYAEDELVLGSESSNGKHSYMTPIQANFANWMIEACEAIPVTARGSEAFSRVKVGFKSYAILANGAVVLNERGELDKEWDNFVRGALMSRKANMDELLKAGNERAQELGVSIRSWIVMEVDSLPTYVVFKENDGNGSRLREVVPDGVPSDWVVHHNGNNLALIPPVISKRIATAYLLGKFRRENPARPAIGLGDSMSDMSYLSICDWWGAPKNSQISEALVKANERQ